MPVNPSAAICLTKRSIVATDGHWFTGPLADIVRQ